MGPFYPLLSILEDGLALVPSNSKEDYEDQSVVNYLNLCRISSLWPSFEKKKVHSHEFHLLLPVIQSLTASFLLL